MASPWKHPKTGTYYLRRKIPLDVRDAFNGREMFKQSLETKDAATAREFFNVKNGELEKMIIAAREGIAYTPALAVKQWFGRKRGSNRIGWRRKTILLMKLDLAVAQIDANAYSHERTLNPIADWERLLASDQALSQKLVDQYDEPDRPGMRWGLWRFWKRPRAVWEQLIDNEVEELVEAMPAIVCERHDLAEAVIDFLIDGFVVPVEKRGDPSEWKPPVKSKANPEMRLSEVFDLWKTHGGAKAKTKQEFTGFVSDFISFAADPPVGKIEKYLLEAYRDLAVDLPASMPRKVRAMGFRQRVVWAQNSSPPVETISAPTLKKRIGAVSAVVAFAHRKGIIESKPSLNVEIDGYARYGSPRRLFSDEEVTRYFNTPLFTDLDVLLGRSTDAEHLTAAWISLIALSIGCRLSEATQLLVDDIQVRDGHPCFIFTQEDHETGQHDAGKRFKTPTRYVAIPIPNLLFKLGFDSFVDWRRSRGDHHLFPDIHARKFGAQKLSDFLNSHIDQYVSQNRNLVFHSMRHRFKARGRHVMSDEMTREIARHAPQSASEDYGRGDIKTLKSGLDKVSHAALPLHKMIPVFHTAAIWQWSHQPLWLTGFGDAMDETRLSNGATRSA